MWVRLQGSSMMGGVVRFSLLELAPPTGAEQQVCSLQPPGAGRQGHSQQQPTLQRDVLMLPCPAAVLPGSACRFVTEPHCGDDSFQRIGKLFKAAKQQRGLA